MNQNPFKLPPTLTSNLSRVRSAFMQLQKGAGWRARRNASLALSHALSPQMGAEQADAVACAVVGAKPVNELSAGEALQALRALGIKLNRSKLYRLARRGGQKYWMEVNGGWNAPDSPDLIAPIAEVEIIRSGAFKRFIIHELKQNSK